MEISEFQKEKIAELERLLAQSLKEGVDFDGILSLADELAKSDDSRIRFYTDAAIIDRLGKELVSVKETALSELVKNSYDADASEVTLTFENSLKSGGKLIIVDNGNGMSRDEIVNGFMTLSSTEKVKNPTSPTYKRVRAGRKGIGRFATQRLARKLTIITETKNASAAYRIEIDWSKFRPDTMLSAVTNKIQEVTGTGSSGTTMVLEGLNDAWSDATLQRVYRYLINLLIPPFNEAQQPRIKASHKATREVVQGDASEKDPGFDVVVVVKRARKDELIINTDSEILDNALAQIEAQVIKGQGQCVIKSKPLQLNEKIKFLYRGVDEERNFEHLDNVRLTVHYFILGKAKYVPAKLRASVEDFLSNNGGIRLYRNGFRVPPYGQSENDWVGLDYASGRRLVLPPFSNNNFFGFVEILDLDGREFQETSSREGLVSNAAYEELRNFVYSALRAAVLRIASARDRKKTASEKGWVSESKGSSDFDTAIDELETIAEDIEKTKPEATGDSDHEAAERLKRVAEDIRNLEEGRETERAKLIEELAMMRILAGLGMSIVTFTHEVKHNYAAMIAELDNLVQNTNGKEFQSAERLLSHFKTFKAYTAYFDRAASANVHRELEIQDLAKIGREFSAMMKNNAASYGIDLMFADDGNFNIFTLPMHWSEWHSILLNLYTNSLKAIQRARKNRGIIDIKVGRSGEKVFMEFSDNGTGISSSDRDRIFQPFFTTSISRGPKTSESDELRGMGLGLTIVRDMLTGYGGTIEASAPPGHFATRFRVEVPRATQEQIEAHGY